MVFFKFLVEGANFILLENVFLQMSLYILNHKKMRNYWELETITLHYIL